MSAVDRFVIAMVLALLADADIAAGLITGVHPEATSDGRIELQVGVAGLTGVLGVGVEVHVGV